MKKLPALFLVDMYFFFFKKYFSHEKVKQTLTIFQVMKPLLFIISENKYCETFMKEE